MELVAYAIGRIALASGSIIDSYVDYEVKRAFEFIGENTNDSKKQLGVSLISVFKLLIKFKCSFSYLFER
jgi:FKBP12-rapamycin complex-associated protein